MAVSIDNVYQKVLAIANKEQRGYITPQEFNLFANHTQMDIFEQYFYDINQFSRVPGNDTSYSDMLSNLEEKISLFERYDNTVSVINSFGDVNLSTDIPDLYRLGMVRIKYESEPHYWEAEEIQLKELMTYNNTPLTKATKTYPLYITYTTGNTPNRMKIYPYPDQSTDTVKVSYVIKPGKVEWGYTIVNEQAQYNASTSSNFKLHPSEETNLIIKILALAGVMIKDPALYQAASREEIKNVQQEKQ